eukprot:m.30893 g.30893  ORF g.30893 m.30893 type:complete len:247 (-) comp10650_c0_seq1:302-1042(-)
MDKVAVDMSGSSQEVWLLKVPAHLANVFDAAEEGAHLGEVRQYETNLPKRSKMDLQVSVPLLEAVQRQTKQFVPSCYTLRTQRPDNLTIFSEEEVDVKEGQSEDDTGPAIVKAQVLGHVGVRADCAVKPGKELDLFIRTRPTELTADKKTREAGEDLTRDVLLMEQSLVVAQKRERERLRKPLEEVKAMLFALFRKHEFYTLEQLAHQTKQPTPYLESILRTIAVRESSGEHRNKWHLRKAFRDFG